MGPGLKLVQLPVVLEEIHLLGTEQSRLLLFVFDELCKVLCGPSGLGEIFPVPVEDLGDANLPGLAIHLVSAAVVGKGTECPVELLVEAFLRFLLLQLLGLREYQYSRY